MAEVGGEVREIVQPGGGDVEEVRPSDAAWPDRAVRFEQPRARGVGAVGCGVAEVQQTLPRRARGVRVGASDRMERLEVASEPLNRARVQGMGRRARHL